MSPRLPFYTAYPSPESLDFDMYAPIPGFTHLRVYVQPDPVRYNRPEGSDAAQRKRILELVQIVLETAAGQRSLHQLRAERFHPSIHLHLRAWTKGRSRRSASCQLLSLHCQPSGEYYGSAALDGERHAFTGRLSDEVLMAFRLL